MFSDQNLKSIVVDTNKYLPADIIDTVKGIIQNIIPDVVIIEEE